MLDEEKFKEVLEYAKYRKNCFYNYLQYDVNTDYDKILNARYAKVSRIKKRLLYLISHRSKCYFITFTFDNNLIEKCDRTKKDLIKKCLTTFDNDILIILNQDFGKTTEREHYHAIVGTNSNCNLQNFLDLMYPSFSYTEKINKGSNSIKKLSKYINKLSNHCIKSSTRNSRIYFNFKGFNDEFFYQFAKKLFLTSH